jgi:hypothetical protein
VEWSTYLEASEWFIAFSDLATKPLKLIEKASVDHRDFRS